MKFRKNQNEHHFSRNLQYGSLKKLAASFTKDTELLMEFLECTVSEFQFLGVNYPNLSISSGDVMYSKIFNNGKNYYSFGVGAGFITKITRGEYINSDPGLFSNSYFQKIRSSGFGVPLCMKVLIVPTSHFGGGLSFYANINTNTFYNISVAIQIGKLRNGREPRRAVSKQSRQRKSTSN